MGSMDNTLLSSSVLGTKGKRSMCQEVLEDEEENSGSSKRTKNRPRIQVLSRASRLLDHLFGLRKGKMAKRCMSQKVLTFLSSFRQNRSEKRNGRLAKDISLVQDFLLLFLAAAKRSKRTGRRGEISGKSCCNQRWKKGNGF